VVWQRREDQEELELHHLSPWAAQSSGSGGRRVEEPEDPLRTAFQRDRDRIIHSTAFRRLQHKTQVVAAYEGDHYRTRMTHSLEVSQMARGVARSLRLNGDLAEAVALGHDIGHPPFGHAGEKTLDELMADHGGFRHNTQGLRIVDYLEDRNGDGHGLNLVLALRRSLLKGKIPDGFPISSDLPGGPAPLEAHVVDMCDQIAYVCHDLDDGLRAKMFTVERACELSLWKEAGQAAGSSKPSRVISEMVALLIRDLVIASDFSLNAEDSPRICHGEHVASLSKQALAFLSERFYHSEMVRSAMLQGSERIVALFDHLVAHPDEMPATVRNRVPQDGIERAVCDYVSGMTDRFLFRHHVTTAG